MRRVGRPRRHTPRSCEMSLGNSLCVNGYAFFVLLPVPGSNSASLDPGTVSAFRARRVSPRSARPVATRSRQKLAWQVLSSGALPTERGLTSAMRARSADVPKFSGRISRSNQRSLRTSSQRSSSGVTVWPATLVHRCQPISEPLRPRHRCCHVSRQHGSLQYEPRDS